MIADSTDIKIIPKESDLRTINHFSIVFDGAIKRNLCLKLKDSSKKK